MDRNLISIAPGILSVSTTMPHRGRKIPHLCCAYRVTSDLCDLLIIGKSMADGGPDQILLGTPSYRIQKVIVVRATESTPPASETKYEQNRKAEERRL